MRTDKNGHSWVRQDGTARAVCPFCGVESKVTASGPKGGSRYVFRKIGVAGGWAAKMPNCDRALYVGATVRYRPLRAATIVRVVQSWPPRFDFRDALGRQKIIPVMAYWRARRAS